MTPGVLFVVGTPIGNLEDITYRAIRTLGEVAVIAAEDTRVTSKLLARYNIKTSQVSYREQNAKTIVPKLLERLRAGDDVAMVTDAGTPSVSDPGIELVQAASRAGINVTPIPGASALACAISVAGLDGEGVRFVGFLPRSGKSRRERIGAIAVDPSVVVLYESPNRLRQTLMDLADQCGDRSTVVMRELTKLHEEIARGNLTELAKHFEGKVRGEITLVVAGSDLNQAEELTDEKLTTLIKNELEKGRTTKDVAASLSSGLGIPKKKVYKLALEEIAKRS